MKKSSLLFCVSDRSFVISHPQSLGVRIPALFHSHACLSWCQVSLKSLFVFGFYLFQFFFSVPLLTFNWNILQHLPFMSCLLASLGLSSSVCSRPSRLLLHSLILSIFSLLFHRTAVLFPPTVCLSPRLLLPCYLFPVSLSKIWAKLCLFLFRELFLRLPHSKWLTPSSFPESFICFVRKRKEAL